MNSFISYAITRFIDIILLIGIIYTIQMNIWSGMTMNIEDSGNPTFILTLASSCYFAGYSQCRMDNSK